MLKLRNFIFCTLFIFLLGTIFALQPFYCFVTQAASNTNQAPVQPNQFGPSLLPGDLDPSFDLDGLASVNVAEILNVDSQQWTSIDEAQDIGIDGQGRIYVAGRCQPNDDVNYDACLARFLPNGELDPDFYFDPLELGVVYTSIRHHESAYVSTLLVDNKGYGYTFITSNFGTDIYKTNHDLSETSVGGFSYDFVTDGVMNPDGSSIIIGNTSSVGNKDIFVTRLLGSNDLNQRGNTDLSFGNGDGIVYIDIATQLGNSTATTDDAHAVTIDTDGNIYIASRTGESGNDTAITKLKPNGDLDNSFGNTNGTVALNIASLGNANYFHVTDIAVDKSNNIYIGGNLNMGGSTGLIAVAKLNSDGSLDTSYGENAGLANILLDGSANISSIFVEQSGKVTVSGTIILSQTVGEDPIDFLVARLDKDGLLDSNFASGKGYRNIDFYQGNDEGFASTLYDSNTFIVVGGTDNINIDSVDFALTRLISAACGDGVIDGDEQCDDGNQINDDDCNNLCTIEQPEQNQQDHPDQPNQSDPKNPQYLQNPENPVLPSAICGNGILEIGEACDDGNQDDTDRCLSTCQANNTITPVNGPALANYSVSGGACGCQFNATNNPNSLFSLLIAMAGLSVIVLRQRKARSSS